MITYLGFFKKMRFLFFLLPIFAYGQQHDRLSAFDKYVGIKISPNNVRTVWVSVGSKPYFIYEFGYNFPRDNSMKHHFYDDRQIAIWNHERLPDIERLVFWSTGTGYQYNRYKVHVAICMYKIDKFKQFYDKSLYFSPNGFYSFKYKTEGDISFKTGFNVNIRGVTLGYDREFGRKNNFFSIAHKF